MPQHDRARDDFSVNICARRTLKRDDGPPGLALVGSETHLKVSLAQAHTQPRTRSRVSTTDGPHKPQKDNSLIRRTLKNPWKEIVSKTLTPHSWPVRRKGIPLDNDSMKKIRCLESSLGQATRRCLSPSIFKKAKPLLQPSSGSTAMAAQNERPGLKKANESGISAKDFFGFDPSLRA